ncbi:MULTISPECIES: Asp23/Gls24 family envelope stress response protein [unclassified Cytobacillus]|uniref:Asp23/Gls24 family envelope stress response protein n=1 Tax=unclassified Cytobacillus TaxID=2675268 RepID=UPI001F47369B|nr:Asp23/Gls24 family envelope stress response protein [Cytobacillus sp. AMY 15.2]MCM3089454.1 Asp23/Gls24 family envelope stress response protein [Cytobacillus sp. AMY 15.2]
MKMNNDHLNFETMQAASDIISAIVESSLEEKKSVIPLKHERFTFFKKKNEPISIFFRNTEVYLKIKLNIVKGKNILEETLRIQKEIKDEIVHLTGLEVKRVDLSVQKIISAENALSEN